MVTMTQDTYDAILAHARRETPIEACGYLAADAAGRLCTAFPMTNVDRAADHYTLAPEEQFAVVRAIRERNLRLEAVYHSHPVSPARPSAEDIRLAYDPRLYYVIITLLDDEPIPVRVFSIANGTVVEHDLQVEARGNP